LRTLVIRLVSDKLCPDALFNVVVLHINGFNFIEVVDFVPISSKRIFFTVEGRFSVTE
jgi:hypothetical protein